MRIEELWKLRIEHDYYRNRKTSIFDVQVSTENRAYLMHRQLLLKRTSENEWTLLSIGDDVNVDDADVLELELVIAKNEFNYITDWNWNGEGKLGKVEIPVGNNTIVVKDCMIIKSGSSGVRQNIIKLFFPIGKVVNGKVTLITTATLSFGSICKYWEYLFLPRQLPMNKIRLEDISKTISFGEAEQINFHGRNAYLIRSLEKICLREDYGNIRLVLWETQGDGHERILLKSIDLPEPSMNMALSPDAVTRALYC